jgi:hypothetical protein
MCRDAASKIGLQSTTASSNSNTCTRRAHACPGASVTRRLDCDEGRCEQADVPVRVMLDREVKSEAAVAAGVQVFDLGRATYTCQPG